jgi:hypothetical protein
MKRVPQGHVRPSLKRRRVDGQARCLRRHARDEKARVGDRGLLESPFRDLPSVRRLGPSTCGCRKFGSRILIALRQLQDWVLPVVGLRSLPAALESSVHEFERHLVVAVFRVQAAAQVPVELVDIEVPEAASLVDVPSDLERHLVHDAEDVPARRLGESDFTGFEVAERVDR